MTKELGKIESIKRIQTGELVINNINYVGCRVVTDATTIMMLIDIEYDSKDCGYSVNDNYEDFIGAEVEDVDVDFQDNAYFINLTTDNGALNFEVFNDSTEYTHNILVAVGSEVMLEEVI